MADFAPRSEELLEEVLAGLRRKPKDIPCKFLYDERGSRLFERICELDEYYLTRTELAILREHAGEIAALLGPRCLLVEYGSGSSLKTRVLLDRQPQLAAYVPIDISREHLLASARRLRERYGELEVLPVCADYTGEYSLPVPSRPEARRAVFFPGSTIGNFEPSEAQAFLKRVTRVCGRGGGLVIGVDLHKDTETLEAAYDDGEGVSAAFALNLLERLNNELGADFELERFAYQSHYDEARRRIVMAVQSLDEQTVHIAGEEIRLDEGEPIRTEHSYKYTLEEFRELAAAADLAVERVWTDPAELFSVQYLTAS